LSGKGVHHNLTTLNPSLTITLVPEGCNE